MYLFAPRTAFLSIKSFCDMVLSLFKAISVRTFLKLKKMPTKHSECPITNPQNCKEYYNPQICLALQKTGHAWKKIRQEHWKNQKKSWNHQTTDKHKWVLRDSLDSGSPWIELRQSRICYPFALWPLHLCSGANSNRISGSTNCCQPEIMNYFLFKLVFRPPGTAEEKTYIFQGLHPLQSPL